MEKVNVAVITSSDEAVNPTTQLTLSYGDFHQLVELSDKNESWLSKAIFPQEKTLAVLAHLAYIDDLHEASFFSDKDKAISNYEDNLLTKFSSWNKALDRVTLDGYQRNLRASLKQMSEEWQLLSTARNESDGYFGAAFWNSGQQQLVLSHRGTNPKDVKALLADIEGVMRNQHTSQMDSACTFVEHVLRELSHKKRFKQIQISITGHSLGAWLAQVTAFSAQYLTIDREMNKFRLKSEEDLAYHAHTVGFESPGCRRMLTKLCEMFHRRYEKPGHSYWTELDISLYLTRPNMVNTCCKHVGTLFQIDIPPFVKDNCWLKMTHYTYYIIYYHSMKNIVMAMNNNNRVKMIHDWPLVIFANRMKEDAPKPSKYLDYTLVKLIKSLPSLIYDYIAKSNQEVDEFWAQSTDENNFSPEHDKNVEGGIRLHYKVRDIATSVCHLSTFSKVERLFLFCWPDETSLRFNMKAEITKELPNFKLDEHDFLFENFLYIENDCKRILCDNYNAIELINFTKQLFRFINEPKKFVQNLALVTQTSVSICKKFSECYVRRVIIEHLDFKLNEEFKSFFSLNEFRNVFLIKTRFKFKIQKIHSILRALNKSNFLFLDLTQLTHLNDYLYLSETIKSITDHVLVLDCQQTHLNEKDVNFIATLLVNAKKLKAIVVIRSDLAEIDIKKALRNDVKFMERDSQLYFSDLTPESNQWLRNVIKDKIILRGKKLELFDFINKFEALDGDIVAELMKKDRIFEIGSEPMKLCQSEASYAKRLKFIRVEHLVQAFKNDSNERKNEIFLITGSNEINRDEFLQMLQIKDEADKQIIKDNTNVIVDNECNSCQKISLLKSGTEVNFKSFCYYNSDKVVFWLEIINKQFYLHQIFDTDFYIRRHLYHGKSIQKDAISDLGLIEKFVISGSIAKYYEDSDKIKQNIYCAIDENEALDRFNDWCAESENTSVHLLKVTGAQLIWQKSHSSINGIRNYLDKNYKQEMDERALANLNNRVIIIVAEPGMGKSTTLTRLSEHKLNDNWVIRLNLKDHLDEVFHLPDDYYRDNDEANRSIITFLMRVSRIHCKLTQLLLKYSLDHSVSLSLLILFDGYDEIDKEHQVRLILLMKYLKAKRFANLWITSRKHFTKTLEDELCVFSTTFKELTLKERVDFLKYFWQVRLKLELSETEYEMAFGNSVETNKFKTFSSVLLEKVDKVLDERMSKFMGIPLQMRLLAENFLPDFEKYIKSCKKKVPQFRDLNVTQIYQRFIKVKFGIYFEEKTRLSMGMNEVSSKWFSEDLSKRHEYIAFQILFPDRVKHLIEIDSSFSEKDLVIDRNEEMGLKAIGLVHSPDPYSGQLDFIHRTFAEYFLSKLILDWLRKPLHPKHVNAIESLLKKIFKNCDVICSFLNEQISETDVSRTKPGCFSRSIFDDLDIVCKNNHLNLIKFILSFFRNKVWLLKQCQFDNFLNITLNSHNSEITRCVLQLIINHYDVLHRLLSEPSRYIGSYNYKLGNCADALHNRMESVKKENVKTMMSAIKHRTKIIENFVKFYYLEDLCELFESDRELCRFMKQLRHDAIVFRGKEGAKDEGINRLVKSIRDKYEGEVNTLNELLLKENNCKDKKKSVKNLKFLFKFLHLLREDKPRQVINKNYYLSDTFREMKMLGIVVIELKKHTFQTELLRSELKARNEKEILRFLVYFHDLADIVEIFRDNDQCCRFFERFINDEELSELLSLLEYFKINQNVDKEMKSVGNFDTESAIKSINESAEDIPKVFPIFKYYDIHFRQILHRELKAEDRLKFVFWGFRNTSELLSSIFPPALLNAVGSFLSRVEGEATTLLSRFFPILTMVEFINLEFDEIAEVIERLLKDMEEDKTMRTSRDVLNRARPSFNDGEIADDHLVDVDMLKGLLRLLLVCNDKSFHETIAKLEDLKFQQMLRYGKKFPGIFFLIIFNIFKSKFSMYDRLSQEKICFVFDFIYGTFPDIARSLAMSPHILGLTTHIGLAIEYNYAYVVSLLFKILKRYPKFLGHSILFPKSSLDTCLHYAVVEGRSKTLEHFLMELNRNADVMNYVIERFVLNEEDKFNFFQAAEARNPGALLIFLDNLKTDYDVFKSFVLPEDKRAKPAFYFAAEKGCKEVMDTLLSALKSDLSVLWELLIWAGPNSGKTALHRACEGGYVEIVDALLDTAFAHFNKSRWLLKTDKCFRTALDLAILSKRQIIRNAGDFVYDAQHELIESLEYKTLQESFGNENLISKQIECLHKLASSLKHLPMVVNALLIIAKSFNNVELMLAIFENADLKAVLETMYVTLDSYGYRLFNCAIERDSLDLVRELIERGIDASCTNGYGYTPLMRAVQKNKVQIAELLLRGGADMYARDMNGTTAFALATDDKNKGDMMIRIFHSLS